MKRRILTTISLILLLSDVSCARRRDGFFSPHRPTVTRIGNGIEVMTIEDREFPTAQFFFYIRGGSVYDPPGKEGLAGIAMQTLRLGGADGLSPDKIEDDLEFVGASLEMGTSAEYESASLNLLTKDLDHGLDTLFHLLRKPALDPRRFGIVKARAKDAILRDQEDPIKLAVREFSPFVYGPGSPWGRHATPATIDNISLDDVKSFLQKAIVPERILVAAAGDFSAEEITQKIASRVQDWKASGEKLAEIPPLEEKFEKGAIVLSRPELTQSSILVGHLGGKRENQDKFPLLVMNFILGGSGALTSRMGEEIRSSSGKAYSVWSDFGFGRDYGLFRAVAQTALENTDWVAKKMALMIRDTHDQAAFSDAEVASAERAILRSLIFDFETRFAQVREQALFHLWGYPADYIETFQKKIGDVTPGDVGRAAKKYLHPDGLKVLIVTDEKKAAEVQAAIKELGYQGQVESKRY